MDILAEIPPRWMIVGITISAFAIGWRWARRMMEQEPGVRMESTPKDYGTYLAMWALLPMVAVWVGWILCAPSVVAWFVVQDVGEPLRALPSQERDVMLVHMKRMASMANASVDAHPFWVQQGVIFYRTYLEQQMGALNLALLLAGTMLSARHAILLEPNTPAGTHVRALRGWLVVAALCVVAILVWHRDG